MCRSSKDRKAIMVNWELSTYSFVPGMTAVFLFALFFQTSRETGSVVVWRIWVVVVAVLMTVGLALALAGLRGQRLPTVGQAKALWLMSVGFGLFFLFAALAALVLLSGDLESCLNLIPGTPGITRCDFVLGERVLSLSAGVGVISSVLVLFSSTRALQKLQAR